VASGGRLMMAFSGRGDRRLGETLRHGVSSGLPSGPGSLLGLELEFSVRVQGDARVHFGSLIHRLPLDGNALDPGDPNAYRCSWGGVITSDGAEAEIATPPVPTRPGFAAELQAWAAAGETALRRAVPSGMELEGYSAHFSAAMPAKLNDPVCRLYAETFAADLMLLTDRVNSPGLLVRPRPGRTELCGEFVEEQSRPAVAAFVAGTTRACAAAVRKRSAKTVLPPGLEVRLARAVHRYGWYVDRRAFGTDLHAAGRQALLPRASGGTISAQSHLELAWMAARQALADDAAASDLRTADAMVAGAVPLPTEHGQPGGSGHGWSGHGIRFSPGDSALLETSPVRLRTCARPGFTLRPVTATWDFTVFEASNPPRKAYVCVPRNSLPGFVERLETGGLDDAIAGYLAHRGRGRVLSAHEQTRRLRLYDGMGPPAGLLAPERDPQTGRLESGPQGAKRTFTRPGKRHRQEDSAPRAPSGLLRRTAVIGAVVAVVLAAVAVAVATLGHGRGAAQAPVSFSPSALSFPDVAVNASVTRSLTMTNTSGSPVTVTQIGIAGSGRNDFSPAPQDSPGLAHRSGLATQSVAQPPSPCTGSFRPAATCDITLVFTPSAPGPHTAELQIYIASRQQPQDVTLTGTGTPVTRLSSVSVTGIDPASGPAAGGTQVTITGTGFTAGSSVDFGTTASTTATVDSSTTITATSPPGTGTVDVTVTTAAGTSADTAADQFTYLPATTTIPTVTSIDPASGPAAGGTQVTITGTGFTAGSSVDFGTTASTTATVDSSTTITATSPPGTGTVDVTVTTAAGTSAGDQFTYLPVTASVPTVTSIDPAGGTMGGGTRVTITGTGFTASSSVDFGSTASTLVRFDSSTTIIAASPASASAGPVDITVTTAAGTSADTAADLFQYLK
jgi:IPT/TIG domain